MRAERAVNYYKHGIARIEDRWTGQGQRGHRFAETNHIYAADLDLFGKGSLFELLSVARTRMGEDTLARWLLAPAAPAEMRSRHASMMDLRERLDLREEMAVLGEEARWSESRVAVGLGGSAQRVTASWLLWVAFCCPPWPSRRRWSGESWVS